MQKVRFSSVKYEFSVSGKFLIPPFSFQVIKYLLLKFHHFRIPGEYDLLI